MSSERANRSPGRFDVEATLGAGGMGTVFRAHDSLCGRFVALKRLLVKDERRRDR